MKTSSSKRFLSTVAAAAAILGLNLAAAPAARAAAPQVKTQAPGYYRLMLGDIEVTALSDGSVVLPMDKLLTGAKPEQIQQALKNAYLDGQVETSVNGYLINTGSKLVLIDTGAAALFGPTLGRLAANLRAAGYQPEQVDEVYITHLHSDHAGGLVADGKPAFPNAVVRIDKREADHWLSAEKMAQAPEAARGGFKAAQSLLKPYQDAGRLKPFDGATELVPGVRALPSYGHTPGHTVYMVESKGQKMAVWGDLMHVAAVQFPDPTVTISFDTDSASAMPQRQQAYADAAKNGYLVAVAHISFPGLGRLRADGKGGYVWVPLNYSSKP
ncbi:MBL fold metallo-hydrolase [Roseateles violae]|uniref:MBL fold metallo-hydrolase n=1 Tax=Roseateles violae TaxID=3058042 RepID=A0ABT8DQC0_9BURK|nr:MBL fold metallo-hydrolase [Pelomonas sp. PFR6]MDN3919288.1 MBL fold metallo-hydrolase [Pelomonas sp. PFR6]